MTARCRNTVPPRGGIDSGARCGILIAEKPAAEIRRGGAAGRETAVRGRGPGLSGKETAMERKLYRAEEGKMVCGVCAGVAEYFGIDPTVVRLAWVLFCALGGSGVIAYVIAAIIMPRRQ